MIERRWDEPFAIGATALLLAAMQRAWREPKGEPATFHEDIAVREPARIAGVVPNDACALHEWLH